MILLINLADKGRTNMCFSLIISEIADLAELNQSHKPLY